MIYIAPKSKRESGRKYVTSGNKLEALTVVAVQQDSDISLIMNHS